MFLTQNQKLILFGSFFCSIIYGLTFDVIPSSYNFLPKSISILLFIPFLYCTRNTSFNLKDKHLKHWNDSLFFIMIGLFASAIGDVLLTFNDIEFFLYGLCAFLLTHICYGITFYKYCQYSKNLNFMLFMAWIMALFMIFLLSPYLPSFLTLPTYIYIVAITVMISCAILIPKFPRLIFWGAFCFAVSDTMLSVRIFLTPYTGSAYLIWFSYYFAQFLIVIGIVIFNRFRRLSDFSQ